MMWEEERRHLGMCRVICPFLSWKFHTLQNSLLSLLTRTGSYTQKIYTIKQAAPYSDVKTCLFLPQENIIHTFLDVVCCSGLPSLFLITSFPPRCSAQDCSVQLLSYLCTFCNRTAPTSLLVASVLSEQVILSGVMI